MMGLLLQKGVYDIDIIYWFVGVYSEWVFVMGVLSVYGDIIDWCDCMGEWMLDWFSMDNWLLIVLMGLYFVVDVEDILMVNMQLDGGIFVLYQQCYFMFDYWCNYMVIGIEGCIENFGDVVGSEVKLWNWWYVGVVVVDEIFIVFEVFDVGYDGVDVLFVVEFLWFVWYGGFIEILFVVVCEVVVVGIFVMVLLWGDGFVIEILLLDFEFVVYFECGQVDVVWV